MNIEKIKIIKEVAKRIYLNFNVLDINRIICQFEKMSTRKKLRKIFIKAEKTSLYGLNVDDIVHTFFCELNVKKMDEVVDILIMYLYEYIKNNDVNYEYNSRRA